MKTVRDRECKNSLSLSFLGWYDENFFPDFGVWTVMYRCQDDCILARKRMV